MNHLSRDQILHQALDLADLASLNQHDRPNGVFVDGAYSVDWLQTAILHFHAKWPWGAQVKVAAITCLPNQDTLATPSDYIQDVRNGILLAPAPPAMLRRRLLRISRSKWIDLQTTPLFTGGNPGMPTYYTMVPPTPVAPATQPVTPFTLSLQVYPTPDTTYPGQLFYYSMPDIMKDGTAVPQFPDAYVLIEYLTQKAMEWIGRAPAGTAHVYANKIIGELQASGQGVEHEQDDIPLDPRVFLRRYRGERGDWMGATTIP